MSTFLEFLVNYCAPPGSGSNGAGLAVAGAVISMVGLTSVFVPTDLDFLGTHAEHLRAADAHLLPFIAHDRAGSVRGLVARWWARDSRCC